MKRVVGTLFCLAVIAIMVFAVLNYGNYRSMCFGAKEMVENVAERDDFAPEECCESLAEEQKVAPEEVAEEIEEQKNDAI